MSSAFAVLSDPLVSEDADEGWRKPRRRKKKKQKAQSIVSTDAAGSPRKPAEDSAFADEERQRSSSGEGNGSRIEETTHATAHAGLHLPNGEQPHSHWPASTSAHSSTNGVHTPSVVKDSLANGDCSPIQEMQSSSETSEKNRAAREQGSNTLGTGEPANLASVPAASALQDSLAKPSEGSHDAKEIVSLGSGAAPPNSSFGQYLWAELNPNAAAPPSVVRQGLQERLRVYNAILFVPFQLERLLWYGLLVCLDSFLAVFTVLPLRFLGALSSALGPLCSRGGSLHGDQLFDVLCVAIFAATVAFLRFLPAGTIYFWLKDLTQEFLKLHVVHSAVEIFDKISCAFVVDALEALSGTCGLYLSSSGRRWHLVQLVADVAVSLALVLFHSVVLICQFMTFSVAMNSKRSNALIALLIASNFVEIKGTVFKRFDPAKLFVLVGQDVTERFHLLLSLLFVVVEEMDNSGRVGPSPELLRRCGYVFGAEILIDLTKHAVLAKLNDIRPTVYQRFMRDVCEKAKGGQSHTAHRVVAFEPYAPAALFLRIAVTALVSNSGQSPSLLVGWPAPWHAASLAASCAAAFAVVFVAKAALGFSLRGIALHFLRRHPKA